MESENNYAKGFLVGALVGGAVGAIVALLVAPKSGRELRQDIAEKSGDLYDKAKGMLQKEEEVAMHYVNEGRMRAEGIVSNAREQADTLMSNAEQVLREAKQRAAQVKDAAKASIETFRSEL
jgi:gas vesicle protein